MLRCAEETGRYLQRQQNNLRPCNVVLAGAEAACGGTGAGDGFLQAQARPASERTCTNSP